MVLLGCLCHSLYSTKETCKNKIKGVGPLPLSMVSLNGAGGAMNGFIEERQGGREQGTQYAQLDMHGISPVICRRKELLDSGVWERNSLIQVFVLG